MLLSSDVKFSNVLSAVDAMGKVRIVYAVGWDSTFFTYNQHATKRRRRFDYSCTCHTFGTCVYLFRAYINCKSSLYVSKLPRWDRYHFLTVILVVWNNLNILSSKKATNRSFENCQLANGRVFRQESEF